MIFDDFIGTHKIIGLSKSPYLRSVAYYAGCRFGVGDTIEITRNSLGLAVRKLKRERSGNIRKSFVCCLGSNIEQIFSHQCGGNGYYIIGSQSDFEAIEAGVPVEDVAV